MGKEGRRLKRCSISTDVEPTDDHHNPSSLKAEKELQTDVNPKKRKKKSKTKLIDEDDLEPPKKKKTSEKKKKKELKKLRKSCKEVTETIINLREVLLGRANLPGPSLTELFLRTYPDACSSKEEEEPLEEEPLEEEPPEKTTYECCFETEDSDGLNRHCLIAKGLDTSLSRDFLKSELRKYFESCGCQVTRVYVPIECKTGVPLGFAFIDVDNELRAMLNGIRHMGGRQLFVMRADTQPESLTFPNFEGCDRCGTILAERRYQRFSLDPRGGGTVQP